jgi:hypothetical protein
MVHIVLVLSKLEYATLFPCNPIHFFHNFIKDFLSLNAFFRFLKEPVNIHINDQIVLSPNGSRGKSLESKILAEMMGVNVTKIRENYYEIIIICNIAFICTPIAIFCRKKL